MWILDKQKAKKTSVTDSDRKVKMKLMVLENTPLLLQMSESKTTFHENLKTLPGESLNPTGRKVLAK